MAAFLEYGDIGNPTAGEYSADLLAHAQPVIILEKYGDKKTLPTHSTEVMQFRRPQPIPAALVPLQEGVTPDGNVFNYDEITAMVQQYGDWIGLSDKTNELNINNVLQDMGMMQGEQIGNTRELLTWDILRGGTAVSYGGGKTTRGAVDKTAVLTPGLQRQVTTKLQVDKAKMLTQVMASSELYETYAIEASYVGITHTNMKPTIRQLGKGAGYGDNEGFVPTSRYGQMRTISNYEVGNYEDVRYVASPDLPGFLGKGAAMAQADEDDWHGTGASGSKKYDVYPTLVLGRDSFGCIVLAGYGAIKPSVLLPKPRGGDPLGQRGSSGWKMWFCCKILNEAWQRRIEVACSIPK